MRYFCSAHVKGVLHRFVYNPDVPDELIIFARHKVRKLNSPFSFDSKEAFEKYLHDFFSDEELVEYFLEDMADLDKVATS